MEQRTLHSRICTLNSTNLAAISVIDTPGK